MITIDICKTILMIFFVYNYHIAQLNSGRILAKSVSQRISGIIFGKLFWDKIFADSRHFLNRIQA